MSKTDAELVIKFQEGDDLAFVTLYNRYKRSVVLFCIKMLSDRTAAEDIAQDVFLRLYLKRESLRPDTKFKSLIFTVARNLCLNYLRNNKNMVAFDEQTVLENTSSHPLQSLEDQEKNAILNWALAQLNANYREVLILREYQGFSYREIATIIRTSENAVKSKLFKARKKLKEILTPILKEGAINNDLRSI